MSNNVSRLTRRRSDPETAGALLQSWRTLGVAPTGPEPFAPPASAHAFDLPPIVARLDAAEIASRIATWRAASRPLDALLLQGVPPADALRRFGLTHWASGDPRSASMALATAAALAPDEAPLWLDLGSTLHAGGLPGEARPVLERAIALDPTPARAWLGLALAANALSDKKRAEEAFTAALARDPALSEAAFGLGLLCFEQRRYPEAAERWRQAVASGCDHALVYAGLGQALFFAGDFAGAARALGRHVERGAQDPKVVARFALARLLESLIAGDVETAFAAYRDAAGPHAEDKLNVGQTAFQILSAYGHRDAALRLGRARMADAGDDPIQRYLFDAVAGERRDRAPRDYVVAYFDGFAETFDAQLVDVLGYDVPEKLARLVAASGRSLPRALDLGCGTGLAGPHLRDGRSRLVGVDLSPRMLAKAERRGVYDRLEEAEMVAFLDATSEQFDLVFAADAVIYLGDLAPLLRAAARVIPVGGLLAFNVEATEEAPYRLLSSGRFAHLPAAIAAEAAPGFALRTNRPGSPRTEGVSKVQGAMLVFERRAP